MTSIAFHKTRARHAASAVRASLADNGAGAELIGHWPAARFAGKSVALFWPIKDEIDVLPLMRALQGAGQVTALPRIVRKAHPLSFHAYREGDALKRGPYGTAEPLKTAPIIIPDIVLLPLLAFGPDGARLGYGGGFYDRTIGQLREGGDVFACGVAYLGQEAANIPIDRYDERLDGVLTEHGFREF
ncbi:MAG: 5-formyltetrahydrofolate cyclo-ligase [Robiginitomaculum sp.]